MKYKKIKSSIIIIFLLAMPFLVRAVSIPDPLGANDPYELIARIIKGILGLVSIIALLNFVLAGIGIIISRGDSDKLKKHRDNLVWTSVGIVFLFGAYALVRSLLELVSTATGS